MFDDQIKSPALRYHGAKFRLAQWIISHFPKHTCYTEAFGGAAGVLLQKKPAYAEVYNDLDGEIVNFFQVLRDPVLCEKLITLCVLTPYSRDEFCNAWEKSDCKIERARKVVIRASMGFGSAGATKGSTGFRIDTKRKYSTAMHVWSKYPDSIANVGQRLASVLIENRPAIDVIKQHDTTDTLHFVDPPYLHDTREMGNSGHCYKHEMTTEDHIELADVLNNISGMVVISGYPSELYNNLFSAWEFFTTKSRISAYRGTKIKQEVIWLNKAAIQALGNKNEQLDLII